MVIDDLSLIDGWASSETLNQMDDVIPSENTHSTETPLVLVDGHNLLWRAAFGFPARIKNRAGADLTPIFGFFALARAAAKDIGEPAEWIVCFDGQFGATARQVEDEGYKGDRKETDNSHLAGLVHIKAGLNQIGIQWVEFPEYEADDVIATLVKREKARALYIMSTDKDYYQLVTTRIRILNTAMKASQRLIGVGEIFRRYGVTPEQWCDFRALMGDQADNIAGIAGIGPRTAARLLTGGRRLDGPEQWRLLDRRFGAIIAETWDTLLLNRQLIALREVPNVPDLSTGKPTGPWLPAPEILNVLNLW